MKTKELRNKHNLTRKDAVRCQAMGGDVNVYKGSKEYEERAKRRSKQGNGLGAKVGLCGWHREH